MTKCGPPRPFRQAEDTASAKEAAQLLVQEFSRTAAVLRRHHPVDAVMVVVVRDPRTQVQTSIMAEATEGLAGMVDKFKLKQNASCCATEHALMNEARAIEARAEPGRLAQLPDRARASLLEWLLCLAVHDRQGLGWRYSSTELHVLQASVSSWPAGLPYVSPGRLSTAQQTVLLSVLAQHLLSKQLQATVMERARQQLPDRLGSDQHMAIAVLETAFQAEPGSQMPGSEGGLQILCY